MYIDIAMRYPFARFVSARLVVAQSTDSVFIPVVSFARRRSVPQSAPLIGAPFFVLCLWSNQIYQRICPVSASQPDPRGFGFLDQHEAKMGTRTKTRIGCLPK